jgi:hypothetical protein
MVLVRVAVAPEGGARPVFRGGAAALPINVVAPPHGAFP